MPDLSKATEDFNGTQYGHKMIEWMNKIEYSAVLHGWPHEWKLETAKMHIKETARGGYNARRETIRTWEDFRSCFVDTFAMKESATKLWENMKN